MIKYSKLLVAGLFAVTFVFAQSPADSLSAGAVPSDTSSVNPQTSLAVPEPPPPPPPAPAPVKAEEGKTIFDVLRGNAYSNGTAGSAMTVSDLLLTPSDIHGQKFFYISPTSNVGYAAFDMFGGSTLLGLDNGSGLAALVLGYANSSFGIALTYSVAKAWFSNSDTEVSTRTTMPGDNIGLAFSLPLGSSTFYVNGRWLTTDTSYVADYDGDEIKLDNSSIRASVGLIGKSGSLNYDIYAGFTRSGGSFVNPDGDKAVDPSSNVSGELVARLGFSALQSPTARVLVGLNSSVGATQYDEVQYIQEDDLMRISAYISPNIFAELAITENLFAFAGASHRINLLKNRDGNEDTSELLIRSDSGTNAFAGTRYQKTNWALEARIQSNMYNNPLGGFAGQGMIANLGGFIYF